MNRAHEALPPRSWKEKGLSILWITGTRIIGGAERVTLQLAPLMAARGHRIAALYRAGSALQAALREHGIPAEPAAIGGRLNLRAIRAIARALTARSPDIALVTTADEWAWAALAPRPAATRLVLVRHMAIPLPARVRWLANRRADAVVAVSAAVRASLSGRVGIAPAKLHTIPNPVRLPIAERVPERAARLAARRAFGLPTDGHLLGFFGGAEPRKGIRDLLLVAASLDERGRACHLLICGRGLTGAGARRIAGLAAQHGLAGKTHLRGEIDDIAAAMRACDAVALSTQARLREGMPLIALEAMACGTPVAAYPVGGISEALADTGLLAQPDEPSDLARQIARLLDEPGLAETLAARALERARVEYAPELAADRYEALMRALCRPD